MFFCLFSNINGPLTLIFKTDVQCFSFPLLHFFKSTVVKTALVPTDTHSVDARLGVLETV